MVHKRYLSSEYSRRHQHSAKVLFYRGVYSQGDSRFPELYRTRPLCVNAECGLITVNFQGGSMPEMPAFCDNCGAIFGSGFVFENCRNVTLSENRVGPCPNC